MLSESQQREMVGALHEWRDAVLEEWIAANREKAGTGRLPAAALRDHLPLLLDQFIDSAGRHSASEPGRATSETAAAYALGRLAEAVELSDCLRELEELRLIVMNRWWCQRAVFGRDECLVLGQAIDRLAQEVVKAYSAAERRTLEALDDLATSALEEQPLPRLLHQLLSIIVEASKPIDTAAAFLLEGDQLRLRAVVGLREDEVNTFSVRIGEGFAGKVAAQRAPLTMLPVADDPEVKSPALWVIGVRLLHGLPLIAGGELLGVVTVGSLTETSLSKLTAQLLRALSERAADVIAFDLRRRKAERLTAQVEQQRRLLDVVVKEAPVGIAILAGDDLRVRISNRAFLDFVNPPFRSEGIEGRRLDEFAPHVQQSGLLSLVREVQRTGRSFVNPEYFIEDPQRGPTWWKGALVALNIDPTADVMMVAVDVTDSVKQRHALDQERARRDAILRTLPVGFLRADVSGQLVEANDNATKIWGGTAPLVGVEEFGRYRGWWAQTGKELAAEDWALARAVRKGETAIGELIDIERFDGTRGTILNNAAPIRDPSGQVVGGVVVFLDVTEYRQASLQLERQTAEVSAIIDSVADGLVVYDRQGRITRMNATAEALLRYPSEVRTRPLQARVGLLRTSYPDGRPIVAEQSPLGRALRGEVAKGETIIMDDPEGRRRWLSVSAAPIGLPSGELAGAVATFVDVTGSQELRQHMEDFVRMLSHDIRTPLSTVSMQAEILARTPDVEVATKRRAETIIRATSRIDLMIRDLVDTARLETGRYKVALRSVDVREFMTDLQQRLVGVVDTNRIRLELPDQLSRVLADPDRLERILVNLLSNALKYSPPNREVELIAEEVPDGVAITVHDHGQGIAADELPHVFERYFRAQKADHSQTEGLGLGLYITRLLVQAHGGRISVHSELDKGSTFTVTLKSAA